MQEVPACPLGIIYLGTPLVAETLHSQARGPRFNPWSGNWFPHAATKTRHSQINKNQYFKDCLFSPSQKGRPEDLQGPFLSHGPTRQDSLSPPSREQQFWKLVIQTPGVFKSKARRVGLILSNLSKPKIKTGRKPSEFD